jgi:ElaB/YqjD/DUF883 family membrane-anchored ribosome-binding protein
MADGFLSTLARRVSDARDTAEEYGRDTGGRLRHRGEDARGELRRLWSQLEDLLERNLGTTSSAVARSAGHYARDGRDMAYDVADQVRSATRARPLLAIGIAVVATVVVTTLLSGRRR